MGIVWNMLCNADYLSVPLTMKVTTNQYNDSLAQTMLPSQNYMCHFLLSYSCLELNHKRSHISCIDTVGILMVSHG